MRESRGLVDSLVGYIKNSIQEGKGEDKVRPENQHSSFVVANMLALSLCEFAVIYKVKTIFRWQLENYCY